MSLQEDLKLCHNNGWERKIPAVNTDELPTAVRRPSGGR
jgi:hypothetical protein